MQVTRDIVIDLLPLYQAGEASAESRAAVEEFLRHDAVIARLAESGGAGTGQATPPEARLERLAVERTRAMIRRRTWITAAAIFLTLLPFTFAFHGSEVTFFMLRDQPGSAVFLVVAAVFWGMHVRLTRSLRAGGL